MKHAVGMLVLAFAIPAVVHSRQASDKLPRLGARGGQVRLPWDTRFNLAPLIRAVNSLIRGGEAPALHVLMQASDLLDADHPEKLNQLPEKLRAFLTTKNSGDLWWLCPCLYESKTTAPSLVLGLERRQKEAGSLSSSFPILVEQGIPFVADQVIFDLQVDDGFVRSHSYAAPPLGDFVVWGLKDGQFRQKELVPSDNPFSVAAEYLDQVHADAKQSKLLGAIGLDHLERLLLGEALMICEGCLDKRLALQLGEGFSRRPFASSLSTCIQVATDAGLHWDKGLERYQTRDN